MNHRTKLERSFPTLLHYRNSRETRQRTFRCLAYVKTSIFAKRGQMTEADGFSKIKGFKTTYKIIKPGSGPSVEKGAQVTVHATGIVKESNKKFVG